VLEVAQRPPPTLSDPHRGRPPFKLLSILALVLVLGGVSAFFFSDRSRAATGAYSAWISWPAVNGAATARIELNGHLIDEVRAGGGRRYQLHGLWPATRFRVEIDMLGRGGRVLARYHRRLRTARAQRPFRRLYSPTAFINQPIPSAPSVAAGSAGMIADAIESDIASANLANDEHWGIPIVTADAQSQQSRVACTTYGCAHRIGPVRIPTGAEADTGSDHHLVVLQPNGNELDMWIGLHTATGWTAAIRWLESASGPAANCISRTACGGADAADFALGAGVVRPEEIAQGHIDHALAITTPITRQGYVACPAGHGDGRHNDPNALPIGAHLQLDPAVDVAALPIAPWKKVIAVALQRYGAYVVDTGGSIALYAQSDLGRGYNAWAKAGVPSDSPKLTDLPWGSMRVLSMTRCSY
jgi:DNA-binding transcriptional regulator YdaS (Cro superfamily)